MIGLGFRALRGGSVVVAVGVDHGEPRVVLSSFLPTAVEGDRLTYEPYHVAAELARSSPDASAAATAVAEGRERQRRCAAAGLDAIVQQLRDANHGPALAALLINRAGWVTDLLSYSLAAPEHPAVAEGLAVRDALRYALNRSGIDIAEVDEKSLFEFASTVLSKSGAEITAIVHALGATAGKPWRKEQQLASLAAWVTIATRPGDR